MQRIHDWLALAHVHLVQPSDSGTAKFRRRAPRRQLELAGDSWQLTTLIAHLAVLAMERGYIPDSTERISQRCQRSSLA